MKSNNNKFVDQTKKIESYVFPLLKGLASLALISWLLIRFEWKDALQALQGVPWFVIGLGICLFILGQMLGARRLQLLLARQQIYIGFYYSLRLTLAGLFASNFLPSTVGGDAIKVLVLVRQGYGKTTSTATIIADRLINLLGMVFLLPTVLAVPGILGPTITNSLGSRVAMITAVAGLLAAAVYFLGRYAQRRVKTPDAETLFRARGQRFMGSLSLLASRWLAEPKVLLAALVLSWASVFAPFFATWTVLLGLDINMGLFELIPVLVIVYFVTLLPISFNGFGVQEVSLAYLLTKLGAMPGQALALAVILRLLYVATSLLGVYDMLNWSSRKR